MILVPENPFEKFHPVLSADELIEIAFKKGESKSASIPTKAKAILKAKRNEVKRVQNVNEYILNRILKVIQSVPNLGELHPFYQELSHLLVSNDMLKKNLGKINGIIPVLKRLESEIIRKINKQDSPNHCAGVRRQYFARTSSILKKQKKTFKFLEDSRKKLKIIPTIDTALPSVVIAGYPNVGKSSLVSIISSANPEICEYPFTTKKIIIGIHRAEEDYKLFQIIDTPGILDRPMNERNEIEKQSILALRTISNIAVFMFDPTESCGFPVDSQLSLFREIKKYFIDIVKIPYIILLNKMDIATEDEIQFIINKIELEKNCFIRTNAKDGTNINEFVKKIREIIIKENLLPLDLSKFK